MATLVWSIDDGYGDLKGFNGKDELIIPSFVTNWVKKPEDDFSKATYSHPQSHITVELNGIKKLVGLGAQNLDEKGTWDGRKNKHESTKFKFMFSAMLGMLAKNEMDSELDVLLVMGLPEEDERDQKRKDYLVGKVKGTHKIKVTLADDTVIEKTINVVGVVIQSQPFGSWANKALDHNGDIVDDLIGRKTTVVFDLGARTLNVLTLNGFSKNPKLSYTKPYGMFDAWITLQKQIKEVYGDTIPVSRIPFYVERGTISGGQFIGEITDNVYEEHANTLVGDFETEFALNVGEIDTIILTGGGSEVLRKWLEPVFKSIKNNIEVVTFGRMAAAKGYYNFGKRVVRLNSTKEVAATKDNSKG